MDCGIQRHCRCSSHSHGYKLLLGARAALTMSAMSMAMEEDELLGYSDVGSVVALLILLDYVSSIAFWFLHARLS